MATIVMCILQINNVCNTIWFNTFATNIPLPLRPWSFSFFLSFNWAQTNLNYLITWHLLAHNLHALSNGTSSNQYNLLHAPWKDLWASKHHFIFTLLILIVSITHLLLASPCYQAPSLYHSSFLVEHTHAPSVQSHDTCCIAYSFLNQQCMLLVLSFILL
jgi:hypothetical protein